MKRYEELSEMLATDIRNGHLAAGSRLPSIRTLTRQHGVSPSTVFAAYYRLEEKGLVRARERSGYYVAGLGRHRLAEPVQTQPRRVPAQVDISELVFSVLGAAQQDDIVPFGSAFPSPDLFPLPRLARSLAAGARQTRPQDTVAGLTQGHPALRQQIALRYLRLGMAQSPDDLVVTHGALEALNLCLSAVAQPGDLIAVESPGFYAGLAGPGAAADEGAGNPGGPEGGHRPGGAGAGAETPPGQGLLVHDQLSEPDGRQHGRSAQTGTGGLAGAARGAADRGRRLWRAVFWPACPVAGQSLRHPGAGDALQLVQQNAGTGLPASAGSRPAALASASSGSS